MTNTLIEDIKLAFDKTGMEEADATEKINGVNVTVVESSVAKDLPGFPEMHEYYKGRSLILIRRAYRHHLGHATYEDSMDAYQGTKPLVLPPLLQLYTAAFADGIQLGQDTSKVVSKYKFFNKLDQLMENEAFREASEMHSLKLLGDAEVQEFFTDQFEAAFTWFAVSSTFSQMTGDIANVKVWDAWAITAQSVLMGFYVAGYRLGEIYREREVLDGITSATEAAHTEQS